MRAVITARRSGRADATAAAAVLLVTALSAAGAAQAPGAPVPAPPDAETYRGVLDRYCVGCHNVRARAGSLALDEAGAGVDLGRVARRADVWEKVLEKLQTEAMPPPGRPRPDRDTYRTFAAWLETALDRAAAANPDPGRPAIRRLNRLEYANAIRDLLGLEIDGERMLPADDLAHGFDNNGDILTMAPGQLERYMSAARTIGRLAVADRTIEPDVVRYPVSSLLQQDDRMGEHHPFGSRGGLAVRHHFPLDGEYVVRLALRENRGRREPQEVDVRVDGVRVALRRVGHWPAAAPAVPGDPLVVRFPATAGSHVVSVSFAKRTGVTEGVGPARLPLWTFSTGRGFVERMALDSLEIAGPYNPDTLGRRRDGSGVSPGRLRLFTCRPPSPPGSDPEGEAACAREILRTLARRAYRRPVPPDDPDLAVLEGFYHAGRRDGGFDAGIQRALESLLVDPEFLFRVEHDPEGLPPATAYPVSDVELASRLSFFLWASLPDDELLGLAADGRLRDRGVLEAQVHRMLADPRAGVLVTSFAAQWLHLRRMRSVTPDVNAFPEFDDTLRRDLIRETELFLASQLRADRSVVDLLTADHTFVNERLARHYGIPNVYGSRFRRVVWTDEARRGLLGQGSILTVTSLATRTSPVVRGKWVLENLLGTPPPPPPPDVPELPAPDERGPAVSVRARLEAHRANPVCASCHARMDPIGFALEHFDAVGRWRATGTGGLPIDASGTLPDGTTFQGAPGLRDVLVTRREAFVTTVVEKLLTYALGRGLSHSDGPAVRRIVREAAADGHRWSAVILGVVRSLPFQMRRTDA